MTQPTKITIDDTVYVRADSVAAQETTPDTPYRERMKGRPVIVRCKDAGVHFGYYVAHDGREVELQNSRRLWYWKCNKGHSLSGVALHGLHADSKIAGKVKSILLPESCEIIECTQEAADSINAKKVHNT
jgi:hypothetical protein